MKHTDYKAELMKDPAFRRAYYRIAPQYWIARQLIRAQIWLRGFVSVKQEP